MPNGGGTVGGAANVAGGGGAGQAAAAGGTAASAGEPAGDAGAGGSADAPVNCLDAPGECHCGSQVQLPSGTDVCDCPAGTWGDKCDVVTRQIAVSIDQTCAIKSDHTLSCWGYGPTPPPGEYQAVSANLWYSCALTLAGKALCWNGAGAGGGMQDPTPGALYTQISVGPANACALGVDGKLTCWVDPSDPQSATPITAPTSTFRAVAATSGFACGLGDAGNIDCFGPYLTQPDQDGFAQPSPPAGTFEQLGVTWHQICGLSAEGALLCNQNGKSPPVAPPAGTFTSFSLSPSHSCGIDREHHLACWGSLVPAHDAVQNERFTAVATTQARGCGVLDSGEVRCWGAANSHPGDDLAPPSGVFTEIIARDDNVCAHRLDDTFSCWGPQVGQFPLPAAPYTEVALSGSHSCGLASDGTVVCSGKHQNGEALPPDNVKFRHIFGGPDGTCGIDLAGSTHCWDFLTGPLPAGTLTQIAIGSDFVCGIRDSGELVCWGDKPPSPVPSGKYQKVYADYYYACALDLDGKAHCFSTPAEDALHPPDEPFTELALGGEFACGLTTKGSVDCWGGSPDVDDAPRPGPFTHVANLSIGLCGLRPNGRLECWNRLTRPPQ